MSNLYGYAKYFPLGTLSILSPLCLSVGWGLRRSLGQYHSLFSSRERVQDLLRLASSEPRAPNVNGDSTQGLRYLSGELSGCVCTIASQLVTHNLSLAKVCINAAQFDMTIN